MQQTNNNPQEQQSLNAEDLRKMDKPELNELFYDIVEHCIGSIAVNVQEIYDRDFWEITQRLPRVSVRDAQSEIQDLKMARSMRNRHK